MTDKVLSLSIQAIVNILEDKNWSRPQIGKVIGVTPYQVYLYSIGKTKSPSPQICMSIWEKIKIEDQKVLVNTYNSYEELKTHYEIAKA